MSKQRRLLWRMMRKYGLVEYQCIMALILLEVNGLLNAARFVHKIGKLYANPH